METMIEFRSSLTPGQHYIHALWLCNLQSGFPPSASDVMAAIHHLEVIPTDAPVHAKASDTLALLRVLRDRPRDFAAAEKASFRSCVARIRAADEAKRPCPGVMTQDGKCIIHRCGNGLAERCSPLARGERSLALLSDR
jgi:hypothetical protein